jgi:hypothetical protein
MKQMHAHMRGAELEEEKELWEREEALKKRKEELAMGARVRETKEKVSHVFQLHSVVDHCRVMGSSMSYHVFHLEIM